jgi:outer membrane receptor protein involved in Fe transport
MNNVTIRIIKKREWGIMVKALYLLLSTVPMALVSPAWAQTASPGATQTDTAQDAGARVAPKKAQQAEVFSTGVAKGRDILDSAISTSSIRESEIQTLSARSLGEIFHNIPGVRSEVLNGETDAQITIRGLPAASTGAKFLQLQEDGLPVVEFGDIASGGADQFIRADLNLSQIEAIRGGSASTFASNSPGGVINMISKTGDVEGGSVMATAGLDYDMYRVDFDYGAHISDTLRFHVGGFYRQGEGPRRTGYDAMKGGQLKFNITKQFTGGYIRLYAKYLDDRTPVYLPAQVIATGTDSNPKFKNIANFDINHDTLLSRYDTTFPTLDASNNPAVRDIRDGQKSLVKSFGVESQFEVADWTITERFRFSDISGTYIGLYPAVALPAGTLATALGGPGATLSFANGPSAGQVITDPAALAGNGLLAAEVLSYNKLKSLDNVTNDIRATRVWPLGGGELTTTAGFYKSRQDIDSYNTNTSQLSTIQGDGKATLVNVTTAGGTQLSQNGVYAYNGLFFGGLTRRRTDAQYNTNAGFGSINFHIGRLSVGGSLRYDFGNAEGSEYGSDLNGAPNSVALDINGDDVISAPERRVGVIPLNPSPIDYHYHYLSYSGGVNYRIADSLAAFARYSKGARTNADRLLFSPAISPVDGSLLERDDLIDYVRQAEGGVKFRQNGVTLNATAFLANTLEHQTYYANINRKYRTYGVEFEGGYRRGIFDITAGATYTHGEIKADAFDPTVIGNQPAGQPKLFGFIRPAIQTDRFSVGTNIYGVTDRYGRDVDELKLPGYVTVNPFVQFRPVPRLTVSVNANNLFDTKGISRTSSETIPADRIVTVEAIDGRTVSASVRFDF